MKLVVGGDIALEPGEAQMVYVFGGADGEVGMYLTPVMQPGLCDVATTTTTTPSTTTTSQEVRAQVVTPRFAG